MDIELLKELSNVIEIYECTKIKLLENLMYITCYFNDQMSIMNLKLDDNNLLQSTINNYISNHFIRLLRSKNLIELTELNIYDFVEFVNTAYDLSSYCTICANEIVSIKIGSCNKCNAEYYKIVTNDDVIDLYKKDKMLLAMLLLSSYTCLEMCKTNLNRESIFKPLPPFSDSVSDISNKLSMKYEDIMILITQSNNDIELYNKLVNKYDYAFVKFVILSNHTTISSSTYTNNNNENRFISNDVTDILKTNKIMIFRIQHDSFTESKFSKADPQYLFHGSPLSNWYSILRNGLKNLSGSKLMINGNAFGNGIYLSDNFELSFAYGRGHQLYAIGLFQILGNKKDYFKGHIGSKKIGSGTVYVVDDEKKLILKYIILLNEKNASLKMHNELSFNLINKFEADVKFGSSCFTLVRMKRMEYEFEKINKICNKNGWKMSTDGDNIKINVNNTIIEIIYPSDYPASPPFIYILESSNVIDNNKILPKGGLLNEKLITKHWKSTTKIYEIVEKLGQSVTNNTCELIKNNFDDSYLELLSII